MGSSAAGIVGLCPTPQYAELLQQVMELYWAGKKSAAFDMFALVQTFASTVTGATGYMMEARGVFPEGARSRGHSPWSPRHSVRAHQREAISQVRVLDLALEAEPAVSTWTRSSRRRLGIELTTAPEGYIKIHPNHHLWSKLRVGQAQSDGQYKKVIYRSDLIEPNPFPKGYQ